MRINKGHQMKKITTRAEAIMNREQKYFTGKPCIHGHVAERVTLSSSCVTCMSVANYKHRAKVREALSGGKDSQ